MSQQESRKMVDCGQGRRVEEKSNFGDRILGFDPSLHGSWCRKGSCEIISSAAPGSADVRTACVYYTPSTGLTGSGFV